jgi:hypothetical protein
MVGVLDTDSKDNSLFRNVIDYLSIFYCREVFYMQIVVNHLGFRPQDPDKKAIIRGDRDFDEFQIVNLVEMGYNEIGPNTQPNSIIYRGKLAKQSYEWGTYYIADFSDLTLPGIYLITLNNEFNSVPFHIREDLYSRTLRKSFDYIHIQRCGQEVPGYHGPCHLDDARRRDTGEYADTTGGWHDAGDLRKWVAHTMLLGVSIIQIIRWVNPHWDVFNRNEGDLLDELRWGNQFFLKVQEPSGLVWHDVAGGVNGDNSDNHWTDNQTGTADDRYINPMFVPVIQWEFVCFESMVAQVFKNVDPAYSTQCLQAALLTYRYMQDKPNQKPEESAWAILAFKELYGTTGNPEILDRMKQEITVLLGLQEVEYRFGQQKVRGYWYRDLTKKDFFRSSRDSGLPLIALYEAVKLLADNPGLKERCLAAMRLHCFDYVYPMAGTNPFDVLPFGLFAGEPTAEKYRPLGGELTYRYFVPAKHWIYAGLTSHLLSYGVGLTMAAELLNDPKLANLGRRQVEWVMGGNPKNSCLMTGEGINNPYPHSRFLGLIPGGIMNGICGLEDDEPFLDLENTMDWRTTEYWSPHTCFYIWFVSLMDKYERK